MLDENRAACVQFYLFGDGDDASVMGKLALNPAPSRKLSIEFLEFIIVSHSIFSRQVFTDEAYL